MKTKKCSRCKARRSVSEFNKNATRKDGVVEACKKCTRIYGKKHYLENKAYYINKAKQATDRLKFRVMEIKARAGCLHCNERHPACLLFHHRNPDEKLFTICDSVFGAGQAWNKIEAEIAKCDILCANCHAKEHFRLNGNIWPPECDGLTRVPAKDQ